MNPFESLMEATSLSQSAFSMANIRAASLPPRSPKMRWVILSVSPWLKSFNFTRRSFMMSTKDFKLPLASLVSNPSLFIAFAA